MASEITSDARFTTFDLERSYDWPGDANRKVGRNLYNVIDWAGYHRGQIALTPEEHAAIDTIRATLGADNGQ